MKRLRLIWCTLKSFIRGLFIDIKFGSPTFGHKQTHISGQAWVVNTDYRILPHIFEGKVSDKDVIVDVGCGRGRVINWLLHHGFRNNILGIEYDQETAVKLSNRLFNYKNVKIIHGDATELLPHNGTIFYLFNPFGSELMDKFAAKAKEIASGGRDITILYYRPLELDVFRRDSFWHIEEFDIPLNSLDCRFENLPSHRKYAVIKRVTV